MYVAPTSIKMNSQQNTVKPESSTSSDPQNSDPTIKIEVRPDVISESITVYKLKEPYRIEDHTALMCRTMYDAFKTEPVSELDAVRLFVQAMVLVFGAGVITDSLANTLIEGGIMLEVVEVDNTSLENVDRMYHGQDMQECTEKLLLGQVSNPNIFMQAYCGVILLSGVFIETSINEIVYKCTQSKVQSLVDSMGSLVTVDQVTPINRWTVLRIHTKISLHTGLRASMVRALLETTGSNSIRGSLASSILKFVAWKELNHMRMVHEFLLGRYPELLTIRVLRGSLGVLESAVEYLAALDETERPYAKLLYNSLQTKVLDRDHLIDAAKAVKKYTDRSRTEYNYSSALGPAIRAAVTKYLQELGSTGNAVVEAAQCTSTVTDKRILRIIDTADKLFSEQKIGFNVKLDI